MFNVNFLWNGCVDRCNKKPNTTIPVCDEEEQELYESSGYCGILLDKKGPFAACHPKVNPNVCTCSQQQPSATDTTKHISNTEFISKFLCLYTAHWVFDRMDWLTTNYCMWCLWASLNTIPVNKEKFVFLVKELQQTRFVYIQTYFRDCIFDLCELGGANTILCEAIEAYVNECQDRGVNIKPWRNETFCRECLLINLFKCLKQCNCCSPFIPVWLLFLVFSPSTKMPPQQPLRALCRPMSRDMFW